MAASTFSPSVHAIAASILGALEAYANATTTDRDRVRAALLALTAPLVSPPAPAFLFTSGKHHDAPPAGFTAKDGVVDLSPAGIARQQRADIALTPAEAAIMSRAYQAGAVPAALRDNPSPEVAAASLGSPTAGILQPVVASVPAAAPLPPKAAKRRIAFTRPDVQLEGKAFRAEMDRRRAAGFTLDANGKTYDLRGDFKRLGGVWDKYAKRYLFPDAEALQAARDVLAGVAEIAHDAVEQAAGGAPAAPRGDAGAAERASMLELDEPADATPVEPVRSLEPYRGTGANVVTPSGERLIQEPSPKAARRAPEAVDTRKFNGRGAHGSSDI